MTEAEKDRVARMVLAVVREVRRMCPDGRPSNENVPPESTAVFTHPSDEWFIHGTTQ